MTEKYEQLQNSIADIASELFRFQRVFEKAIKKLSIEEQNKYISQFSWFSKRVTKAMSEADLRVLNLEGLPYDPGMAVTPLNIDDFEKDELLFVEQMMEPIIMADDAVYKTGTVILGRAER